MIENNLYKREHRINDHITIKIPTVRDIINDESSYYSNISMIISTPYEMMVQLDSVGIDFSKITEWDLFCFLFKELRTRDLSLIFGDLDLTRFVPSVSDQNGDRVLRDTSTGAIIDQSVHFLISTYLRNMLGIEKNDKTPGNEEARKYMIERARKKLKRKSKQATRSTLEDYIIALVNTKEFPYNYETVLDLTIYQFYASLRQVIRKVKYDNLMIGCYAGTVSMKEIDQKELDWITNK